MFLQLIKLSMKKNTFKTLALIALSFIWFTSCGPSAEERRQQEIKDSIQLEKDRRELLERANRMLDTTSSEPDEQETE